MPKPLRFELIGDTQLVVTRDFDAPPALVWRAHMEPELLMKWQSGNDAFNVVECEIDATEGGTYRIVHSSADYTFTITGTFLELEEPNRILQEEVMHLPDPTPPNLVETLFKAKGQATHMVVTMTLPDAQTRREMMETGMLDGMEISYKNLDALELA